MTLNYCLGQIDHFGPKNWASLFKFLTENGQEVDQHIDSFSISNGFFVATKSSCL